jgi:hypothetical protein
MNDNELQYVVEVVGSINDEIFMFLENQEFDIDSEYYLNVSTDSTSISVSFLGIRIWLNVDDNRDYFNDEPEPLESFLRKQCNAIIRDISKLQTVFSNY